MAGFDHSFQEVVQESPEIDRRILGNQDDPHGSASRTRSWSSVMVRK